MAIDFLYPQYEVVRNPARCIACRACERQCSNEVHAYDDELKMMISVSYTHLTLPTTERV